MAERFARAAVEDVDRAVRLDIGEQAHTVRLERESARSRGEIDLARELPARRIDDRDRVALERGVDELGLRIERDLADACADIERFEALVAARVEHDQRSGSAIAHDDALELAQEQHTARFLETTDAAAAAFGLEIDDLERAVVLGCDVQARSIAIERELAEPALDGGQEHLGLRRQSARRRVALARVLRILRVLGIRSARAHRVHRGARATSRGNSAQEDRARHAADAAQEVHGFLSHTTLLGARRSAAYPTCFARPIAIPPSLEPIPFFPPASASRWPARPAPWR